MSRVNGVQDDEASFMQRFVFRTAAKQVGAVAEPLRVMAKSGGVMWGAGLFQVSFDRAKTVDAKLKTLASLKASSMIGCLF
jgi:hypothetical protein